ncbi:MAG: hypothetical protein IPJ41_13870 [Phycisphaerales bacterium]|nr:hypothetical protein [Phycisphaerales bacterium]
MLEAVYSLVGRLSGLLPYLLGLILLLLIVSWMDRGRDGDDQRPGPPKA